MHFGTIVIDAEAVVLAEEIHARQRRDADQLYRAAGRNEGLHLRHRRLAGPDDKTVGAHGALAVEQGMELHLRRARLRALQPELAEDREFLAFGQAGVQRQSARGYAVAVVTANAPEVAGAEIDGDLVEIIQPIQRIVQTEASEPDIRGQGSRIDARLAEVEQVRRIRHRPRHIVDDLEDLDGLTVIEAWMEELNLEG